ENGRTGLELDGQAIASAASYHDRGLRLRDLDGDGVSECLIAGVERRGVFRWDESEQSWRRLPFDLPDAVTIVDEQGRDAGLRFVDLDEDGYDDVVFSNESGYSIDLFESPQKGWSRHVVSGKRPDDQLVPPFATAGTNAGAWFASRHLWLQNEATDRLKDLVDRRESGELLKGVEPRAKSPAASLASIVTRPGFQVELVACEPLTMDPVAFAWGADGKLWVVEMADYPLGCESGGRVRYLEDRDGDGQYDASTLFLDGLSYPNGVMPWRKGVLVTCAPEIFYAEDSDGDGRADVRRSIYRGFGEGNPQHRVNGLRWGLDNWVYCANGDSGGGIESLITGEKVSINGRDFRIRPDEGSIEPQTGQSQFQRERDDWGNWFGNNNSNPMYHFVLDDHYLRRNPHLAAGETRVQVSMAPGAAPVFPVSRTLERFNDQNAINRFTSACSAIIYRDDLFGPHFAGNSFVSEPVHNLVHREVVYAEGTTFHSRRAEDEQRSEFLASSDNWFRPAMIRVGPDGALWIADMYRQVIEHPEWIPKDWQARLDLRAGHDKGRIYRVFPVGSRPRAMPRLDRLSTNDLVAALDSPSGWQRDLVQQLLIERGDEAALAPLKALLHDAQKPRLARLHALCTLDGLKALDAKLLRESLGVDPGIDRHVIRLSEPFLDNSPELATAVAQLVESKDPQLLMQLTYSLGEWHSSDSGLVLGQLALRLGEVAPGLVPGSSGVDPTAAGHQDRGLAGHEGRGYLTAAILSSATNENLAALVETVFAGDGSLDPLDDFVRRLAELTVAMENDDAQLALLQAIGRPRETGIARWQLTAFDGFLNGVTRRVGTAHRNDPLGAFAENAPQPIKDAFAGLSSLFASARKTVGDADAPEDDRLRAMQLLGRTTGDRDADIALLAGLLAPQSSSRLQSAAIAALAAIGDPKVPSVLLGGWQAYGPELRGQVVDALLARQAWVERLLEEVREQRLPAVALDAARRQRLLDHPDEKIRDQARTLLAGSTDPNREKVVEQYRAATQLTGDAARGAAVFKKSCASCHKLDGVGHAIGADLSALSNRSPEAMLVAIFDPSRAVEAKFLSYTAVTADGRTFNGILASEAGNSVTLLAADGKQINLLRSELDELAGSTKSLMPEGLEKDLTPQDTADLLAYLGGFKPPRKTFVGNQPKVVEPEQLRGEFWLLADSCEIYGKTLIFEPNYRNLGYWQSDDDHAIWSLAVTRPGKFAVSLDYACDNGAAGQTVLVEIAGQRRTATVPGTGNWDTYRQLGLGQVELSAGNTQLTVRPEGPLNRPLIDLKAVRLRPVK
ncbi:MAG TPA: PVC-type heme-binding CxxCH protein, partial [Pirellulales bacterium]|nr:PVC-type heme-binding CxxCH protein [Pirellulales bacterium]